MNKFFINLSLALSSLVAAFADNHDHQHEHEHKHDPANKPDLSAFEHAHIASPEHYTLLLENEEVIVIKMVLKPGQTDNWHMHFNETVYFQQGGKVRIAQQTGDALEAEIPDGHVMWHEAWAHQVSNIGETDIVAIIVEDKPDVAKVPAN